MKLFTGFEDKGDQNYMVMWLLLNFPLIWNRYPIKLPKQGFNTFAN